RLYAGMVAVGMLRGYATPTYTGVTLDELYSVVENVRVVAAIAEDQEHVDKVLDLRGRGVDIGTIVYDDPRGLNAYHADGLVSWDQLQARGAERLREIPSLREDLIARARPDDPAVFLYSSGTTGRPKGIVLSQRNLIAAVRNVGEAGAFGLGEEVLAYLPMAWVGDFALTLAAGVACRFTIN